MPQLPPEYAHLEQALADAREQLRNLNETIDNVPKDKGPQLGYTPDGVLYMPRPTQQQIISGHERDKQKIIAQTTALIKEGTSEENPERSKEIMEKVDYLLDSDNPQSGFYEPRKQRLDGEKKDPVFDKMNAMHFSRQNFTPQPAAPQPQAKAEEGPDKHAALRERIKAEIFKDNRDTLVEPSSEKGKDKDHSPQKETSKDEIDMDMDKD